MSGRKSYWLSIATDTDAARIAVKSWFAPLADDMTPYEADMLCDIVTDREKKLRAFMTAPDGGKHQFERTIRRNFSISVRRIDP